MFLDNEVKGKVLWNHCLVEHSFSLKAMFRRVWYELIQWGLIITIHHHSHVALKLYFIPQKGYFLSQHGKVRFTDSSGAQWQFFMWICFSLYIFIHLVIRQIGQVFQIYTSMAVMLRKEGKLYCIQECTVSKSAVGKITKSCFVLVNLIILF